MEYQCCFCGATIAAPTEEPISITINLPDDATQHLESHSACLVQALHHSVPTAFHGSDIIMIPLLNEGVDVWRPVSAVKVKDQCYKVDPQAIINDDEQWQYGSGSIVRCVLKTFSGGAVGLAAVEEVKECP